MVNVNNIVREKILLDPLTTDRETDDLRVAVKFLMSNNYRMHAIALNRIVLMSAPGRRDILAHPQYESIIGASEILEREGKVELAAAMKKIAEKFSDLN